MDVGIVCDDSAGDTGTLRKLAELEGCCRLGVMRLRMPRLPSFRDIAIVARLRGLFRPLEPDVLHGHGAKGAAYARLLARGLGSMAVCTPHGGALHFSYGSPGGTLFLLLEKALKHRTDAMIFESAYAKRVFERKVGMLTFPHTIAPNGLHEDEFAPLQRAARSYDFLFIGEFRRIKGIFTLVEAVNAVRKDRELSVLMVGSGPDEKKLRERIVAAKLSDTIHVAEPIHPARAAFALARFVVAPSIHESMPYIVLEALAAGIPLLATRVGGVPEVFGPHADELVTPGDPTALADCMRQLLRDSADVYARAAELRDRMRMHSTVAEMESRITRCYLELLGMRETTSDATLPEGLNDDGHGSVNDTGRKPALRIEQINVEPRIDSQTGQPQMQARNSRTDR